MHKGGSTPFYIEITGKLQRDNRLLVVVNNTRKSPNVPAENTDWFNYGGIYRDVELIRLPETFIKDFVIYLKPGSNYRKIHVKLEIDGPAANGTAVVAIPELSVQAEITINNGKGEALLDAAPELWSPQNPKLYEVTVKYGEDRINDLVGFREFTIEGTKVL